MAKVPLTSAGIANLQSNLYALTDPQLFLEAQAVHADFVTWVDDHIVLNAAQLAWLNTIDQLFIDYISAKTAIAMRNRLALDLVVPSATGEGKWFLDKDPISPCWGGPGVITASGTLRLELGYNVVNPI